MSSQYLAVVGYSRQFRETTPQSSGVQVGLGGGISFPIGRPKYRAIALTDMQVQIRRRSDQTIIWEGRAQTSADERARDAQPDAVARKLAAALFQGFPGESGRTITVK
jgi:hypothetical protein